MTFLAVRRHTKTVIPAGKMRRTVDLRVVSFARAVISENPGQADVAALSEGLAQAALMVAGGITALSQMCKAAAGTPYLRHSLGAAKYTRMESFLTSIGNSCIETWQDGLKEHLEILLVFARETSLSTDTSHRLAVQGQALGLDLSPLVLHEDDERDEDLVEVGQVRTKPSISKCKAPAAQSANNYHRERLADLVQKAIASGVQFAFHRLKGGRVEILGRHPSHGEVHLRWLRGSIREADVLVETVNQEIGRPASDGA